MSNQQHTPKPAGYAVMTPFGNVYRFANTLESARRKQEALISKFPNKKQGPICELYTAEHLTAKLSMVTKQRDELLAELEKAAGAFWKLDNADIHAQEAEAVIDRVKGACVEQSAGSEARAMSPHASYTLTTTPAIVFYPAGSLGEAIEEGDTDGGSRAGYECPVCRQCDCIGCNEGGAA